ncbi:unnamed protein product [Schistosoma turkestanicum]|nr:unnamed protein product [Schistosoma turkestanicum]
MNDRTDYDSDDEFFDCQSEACFYAIASPRNTGQGEVFVDPKRAYLKLRGIKGARLKLFANHVDASKFASTPIDEENLSNPYPPSPKPDVESSPFASASQQALVRFRSLLNSGDVGSVKKMIDENPMILVTTSDTPTILQIRFRYNALHVIASNGNVSMLQFLLNCIDSNEFWERLYPGVSKEASLRRQQYVLDLYLNSPELGNFETPLHFASKFGHIECVSTLVRHPLTKLNPQNFAGQTPVDLAGTRLVNQDKIIHSDFNGTINIVNRIQQIFDERLKLYNKMNYKLSISNVKDKLNVTVVFVCICTFAMPLHVDPRKHELLEARIQGTNHIRSNSNAPPPTKSDSYASGYMFPITEEPSRTPEHSVLRGSSSPFSSVGEHDLSTSSSDLKLVSTVVPSISVESNERIPSSADPSKKSHNPNCQNSNRLEITNPGPTVQNSHMPPVQSQANNTTSPTTPKNNKILSSSVGESDNISSDGFLNSLIKSDDKLVEASAPCIPVNPLGSPQCLQYVSRSNSMHTPTTVAGNSPVKQSHTFVDEKNVPYSTFQLSVQPSTAFIETNNPAYHLSPSIGPVTPTPDGQCDSLLSRNGTKKRRKLMSSDEGHTPKPKRTICQERGSKRIDELFKFMPGPLYSSCGSTSPTQNPRLQSPSPTSGHSLDNQMVGINHNYIPSLNEAVTTSCASNDQIVITSVTGAQYANNAATFQLSPVRANSTASLSDSSGENPVSMVGLSMAANVNANPTSCTMPCNATPLPTYSSNLQIPANMNSSQPQTGQSNVGYLNPGSGPNNPITPNIPGVSASCTNNSRSHVGVQTDETVTPSSTAECVEDSQCTNTTSLHNNNNINNPPLFTTGAPASPVPLTTVESLQRRIADLEHEAVVQRETITKLQENAIRSREMIRELLIEKSLLERKTTRQKVMENRLRLGQFITQRQGAHFEEKWIEGSRFKELDQRRKNIELVREEIERKKKQWNKRKPNVGDAKKSTKSKYDEVSVDEFYEQLEIYDLRKQMLVKEDKEIQMELERLDRERNLHIREIKRISNEDASRFKDHPLLNERYLLLNLLGKGGFSEVHKGFDLVANRYVACKIHQLNPAWPKDKKDNYIKHALREIEIHKTLHHPRIPFGHNMSQADILHENTILHARSIVFPSTTKVSDGAKEFIRKCCTYRKDLRPDVFQLSNDDYLKPKAQLKHYLDTSTLPGPVGVPPNMTNPQPPSTCIDPSIPTTPVSNQCMISGYPTSNPVIKSS